MTAWLPPTTPFLRLTSLAPLAIITVFLLLFTGCGPSTASRDGAAADGLAEVTDESQPAADDSEADGEETADGAASGDPSPEADAADKPGDSPAEKPEDEKKPGDPPADKPEDNGGDPAPGDPQPGDPAPSDPQNTEPKPGDPKPGDPQPGDPAPEETPDIPKVPEGHPFPARFFQPNPEIFLAPDFPKGMQWLNTPGPLRKADLKGKFVILDFWTYCCINCMHILPELKKLEHAYPDELVVVGVHSAKFETEKETENIKEAVLRYEIEHPVVNDAGHKIWDQFAISSWPSLVIIDPEGYIVAKNSGEVEFETLERFLKSALPYYRKNKLLSTKPIPYESLASRQEKTPLRFPGKVLADEKGDRLFITDSNHNRIVVTSLEGKLLETIGTGAIGADDGDYDTATFDHPQGLALHNGMLYVADTENHLLRKVDLASKTVTTIAGIGEQWRGPWPGIDEFGRPIATPGNDAGENTPGDPPKDETEEPAGDEPAGDAPPEPPADEPAADQPANEPEPMSALPEPRFMDKPKITGLNSPWALLAHGDWLYIAMAGPHQIWRMKLDESEIGVYAGNGREDIVDGLKLPLLPYQRDREVASGQFEPVSAFAQPSGLATDGKWLFVADSEGSSVRAVPLDIPANKDEAVRTVVGTNKLPFGRLFAFGFEDGARDEAKLQHVLGVAYKDGKIYAADTYNNAIRIVDAKSGEVQTLAGVREEDEEGNGVGVPGNSDEKGSFDEPAGVSIARGTLYVADTNNHAIRTIDLKTGKVATLKIEGLVAPAPAPAPDKPNFNNAKKVTMETTPVNVVDGKIKFTAKLKVPIGWKMNKEIVSAYYLESDSFDGPIDRESLGKMTEVAKGKSEFEFELPVGRRGQDEIKISMIYYFCSIVTGECKTGSVVWTVPLNIVSSDGKDVVELKHRISAL